MTRRPYPSIDRARHQLERHEEETAPLPAVRPLSPFERRFFEAAAAMVRAATPSFAEAGARLKSSLSQRPVSSEETTA